MGKIKTQNELILMVKLNLDTKVLKLVSLAEIKGLSSRDTI